MILTLIKIISKRKISPAPERHARIASESSIKPARARSMLRAGNASSEAYGALK